MTKKIITTGLLFSVVTIVMHASALATSFVSDQASLTDDTTYTTPADVQVLSHVEDGGVTQKELLNGFVQQCFDETLPTYKRPLRRSAGETLTGKELLAYNYVKTLVAQVARGELENTAFSIPLSEFSTETGPWTAEDLGVSSIVIGNTLNTEARDEVRRRVSFDFAKVQSALLADCPFELYWYDKVNGCTYRPFDSYSFNSNQISVKGNATLTMYVSQDYAVAEGRRYHANMFDLEKIARVNVAVANAKQIVDQSSGNTFSRLLYYKDKICDLTSYNQAAVAQGYAFGDPWQLVNVFDNDVSTSVVCEGYAKAFKYLCDLSQFKGVECLLASGMMHGGTGAGAHMWNVMKMNDGRNYLVDVTNCDAGTIGAPDLLFMVYGPSGNYTEGYTYQLRSGSITYVYDDETKALFSERELTMSNEKYVDPNPDASLVISVALASHPTDVYTLQGYKIRTKATSLEGLPKGIYIVNGQKTVVR